MIRASGELDLRAKPALYLELDAALADADFVLVVDLAEVTFMDCSALGVLVSLSEVAQASERRIALISPSRAVRRLLELTGTAGLFDYSTSSGPGESR